MSSKKETVLINVSINTESNLENLLEIEFLQKSQDTMTSPGELSYLHFTTNNALTPNLI